MAPCKRLKRKAGFVIRDMRVLVAMEPRAYREAIGEAIRWLRPRVEVAILEPEELENEIARLDPELVISARPVSWIAKGRMAWVECDPYEEPAATVSLDGLRTELETVNLEDLLWVVDEAEELSHGGSG